MEAELLRREAPPSYGQLIAQGLIPPVEDFPVCSPNQVCYSLSILFQYLLKWSLYLMCSDEGPLIVSEFLQSDLELNGRFEIM